MKLLKKIGLGAMALGVSFFLALAPADAREFGYKIGAGTVNDVTTTACTSGRNGTVTGFGNGALMNQVWDLEREVGSKGSDAWEQVIGKLDVFPTTQGGAAVGGAVQVVHYTSPTPACFRLRMRTYSAGTGQIQLVTDGDGGTTSMTLASHAEAFDDFFHGTLPITTTHNGGTPSYFKDDGSGGTNVPPIIEGGQEGLVTMTSGQDDDAADITVFSFGLATNGALVSSGLQILEFRASQSQITQSLINFGLNDTIGNTTEFEVFECNTNVCAEGTGAGSADAVMFVFDTDSADAQTDMWNAVSMNTSTLGNVADEYTLGHSPVASTFAVFRIEVNKLGHAFWYYNGTLVGAEPLAVSTSAVLIPYFSSDSTGDGAPASNKIFIDYLVLWTPRTAT